MTTPIMKEQISEGSLSEEEEIYRENILDHYRNPRNKEKPESCSFQHLEHNPVCGDRIELFVKLSGSRVEESSFLGEGCAISQASASMLTDKIKGMPVSELQDMAKEDVLDMLGISIGIVRLKCAMLSLKALHKGLEQYTENNRKKQ